MTSALVSSLNSKTDASLNCGVSDTAGVRVGLVMIVAILGTGSGQPNPTGGGALNVTEIGIFDDIAKCRAAIASAHVEGRQRAQDR